MSDPQESYNLPRLPRPRSRSAYPAALEVLDEIPRRLS